MTPAAHATFVRRLRDRLRDDPEGLGLVGLGSTSGLPPGPDEWSDHDLFVVVVPGAQERWRTDLAWLPGDAGRVALSFRETAHAVKVLFTSGHLAELAVFDPDELGLARVNRYAVLLDKADVAARMARVRQATADGVAARPPVDEAWAAGQLLTALVVGAGRFARGERLAAHAQVRTAALGHLVAILRSGLRAGLAADLPLDDLDPMRRLEQALPEAARDLDAALASPVIEAARGILAVLVRERPGLVSVGALVAVRRALDRAEQGAAR
jgi:hypothetical protein